MRVAEKKMNEYLKERMKKKVILAKWSTSLIIFFSGALAHVIKIASHNLKQGWYKIIGWGEGGLAIARQP